MDEYDLSFREFRKRAGFTRTQLGKRLGISRFQIFLWEWNLWSPSEGVQDELKAFLAKFVERSIAALIGTGLIVTAGWLAKFAVIDPEPTSKVAAGFGTATLATIGGLCLYYAATGETVLKIRVGKEIVEIPIKK